MADNNIQYSISLRDMLTPALQNAERHANQLETSLSSIGSAASAAFAAWGLKEVLMDVINVGSELEKTKIGLTTLLGDASRAQGVINQTMRDAETTPFDFEALLKGNQLLISAQVEAGRARNDILNLANAVAATGGGNDELSRMAQNMQQIKNAGAATAADIKQFAFAGINVYGILADALGTTTEKVKDMAVTYDQLTYALQVAHDTGGQYAGGLEAMAGSTAVQISNLGDSLMQIKVNLFEQLKPAVDWFIGALGSILEWLKQNQEFVLAAASAIGIAMVGALVAVTAATWQWTAALLANPIFMVIEAIGFLTGVVVYAWRNFETFRAVIRGVWEFLKAFVNFIKNTVIESFKALGDIIIGALTFDVDRMQAGVAKAANVMFNGGKELATAFQRGYNESLSTDRGIAGANAYNDEYGDWILSKQNKTAGKIKNPGLGSMKGGTGDSAGAKGVQGQKVLNITINIAKLIEKFEIKTTNIQESSQKVKDYVQRALLSAVNDSQIVPDR